MPISVVCPGCKKRFSVSEKFAGQKGPCPKCKAEITIPTLENQVVIHAPDSAAPKDAKGRAISAPILREETRFNPTVAAIGGGAALLILALSFLLRGNANWLVLSLGALGLAPPLVFGGYSFLRNDELEPYRGQELWVRVAACSAAYAFLWAVYWWIPWVLELDNGIGLNHLSYVLPAFVLSGGFAAYAAFDLDYMVGLLHYSLYLLVTVILCFILGVQIVGMAG